jgi:hypothetical protein
MILPYIENGNHSNSSCLFLLRSYILNGFHLAIIKCLDKDGQEKRSLGILIDVFTDPRECCSNPLLIIYHPDSGVPLELKHMSSFGDNSEIVHSITLMDFKEIYNRDKRGIFE